MAKRYRTGRARSWGFRLISIADQNGQSDPPDGPLVRSAAFGARKVYRIRAATAGARC